MARHNELRNGVADLKSNAFTPTHVHYDSKIYTGRTIHGGKDKIKGPSSKEKGELKGGILIKDL